MNKTICKAVLFCLPLLTPFSFSMAAMNTENDYTLEQVLMLSRHGLRAPLANAGSVLGQSTPKTWPTWNTKGGYLTAKGGVLEAYFGGYFNAWLVKNRLFAQDECPAASEVYFYANSLQRTIATAEYFAVGAFPGCNVPIVHKEALGRMDYTFNPIISDGSENFKTAALASMNSMAGEGGVDGLNARLKPAYELVEKIVDYKNAAVCINDKKCSLSDNPTVLSVIKDKEPGVSGPLRLGTSISDAFILQYYEGFPMQDVAWGQIQSAKEWQTLVEIKDHYIDVLFGSPLIAKQVSAPLVSYIQNNLTRDNTTKFTMLVGHDSNVGSLLAALKIKPYTLPDQFEKTPIGGKIVFERWKDKSNNQWVKIVYVYQSTEQIRELQTLSMANPPRSVVLEMQDCPIDVQGFCSLTDFEKALNRL